jgi:MFS family permease
MTMTQQAVAQKAVSRTRTAFILAKILETPLWAMYNMLPFILHKDLHATPWQLMMLFTLRPLLSLLSVYWSSAINRQRHRLLSNVIWGRVLGVLAFLLFPFIDDPWFFICCSGVYVMFARGIVPGWMEILKINLPGFVGKKVFAYTSLLGYLGGGLFSLYFGWLMDVHLQIWRWLFPLAALISLTAVFFKMRVPVPSQSVDEKFEKAPPITQISLWQRLMQPWQEAWHLLRARADFRYFQIGLMISGTGLMVMQPALPIFIDDILQLSYTELSVAISLFKGLGFALTSSFWARWMQKTNIYRFSAGVISLGCLFALLVFGAQFYSMNIYLAFLCYGMMQSGFEMSWNLSGPLFSKDEESSLFSTVNVMTIGMRGCIAPPLGGLLCIWIGSPAVMLVGCLLFALAYLQMTYMAKSYALS